MKADTSALTSDIKSLIAELKPYNHGLFITIHSKYSDCPNGVPVTTKTIERFRHHLDDVRAALGLYCYGRSFRRNNGEHRVFGALETGELGRLHAHLAFVSRNECQRALDDITHRLQRKICPHFSSIATGDSAFDLKLYDRKKLTEMVGYFVKRRSSFINRFGIDAVF